MVPSYSPIGELHVQIPDMLAFITSKNKLNEISVLKRPTFDLKVLLANFLDPKVLIKQLSKGLKYLAKKLVGSNSVLNKIPVKWLKDKIVRIFRSSGNFIEGFRVKVVEGLLEVMEPFQEMDFRKVVRDKLNQLLQPTGLLRNPVTCTNCSGTAAPVSFFQALEDGLEWTVHLGQTKEFPLADLDLGVGSMPIKLQVETSFELEWDLMLTFGFQKQRGFYLKRRGNLLPDLDISAGLKVRNFKASGRLFFLTLVVEDYRTRMAACRCSGNCGSSSALSLTDGELDTCAQNGKINTGTRAFLDKNMIDLSLSIYLLPNAATDYLTLKTLRSGKSSLLAVEAQASFQALLSIKASAGEKLPEFEMVLHAGLSYSKSFGTGAKGGGFNYNLQFLYPHMDIGKFLKASILPVLVSVSEKLSPIVKPMRQLTKTNDILTTIMDRPSSMLDFLVEMAAILGDNPEAAEKAKSVKKLIEVVIEIDDILLKIKELVGDTECFALGYLYNFDKGFKKVDENELATTFPQQQGVQDLFRDVVKSLQDGCGVTRRRGRRGLAEKAKALKEKIMNSKYFKVPMLSNPGSALGLLSGKTVDIVEFTSPRAEIGVDFSITIPIWSPPKIDIIIGGGVSVSAQIIMGFDTSGIMQAIAQKKPLLAFDGFYILTERKKEDGSFEKIYQVTVTGYIEIGLQLSVFVARASASGRITAIIDIGLVDPLGIGNPDRGKLRISTIALAFAVRGLAAFMDLFRIRLRLILTLSVKVEVLALIKYVTVWEYSKSFTLLDKTFEPEAFLQLAEITNDGALYIMVNRASGFAGSLDTVDITVAHVAGEGGAETISIAVDSSYEFAQRSSRQTFENVNKIIQSSSQTIASKPVSLTMRGVKSATELQGNPYQNNHNVVFDFTEETDGVGGDLVQDQGYTVLNGLPSTIKFKHFEDVKLLFGPGADSLVLYATPVNVLSFFIDFGSGQNEIDIDFENVGTQLISSVFQALDMTSGNKVNDTLVFTARLASVANIVTAIKKTTIDIDQFQIVQDGVTERLYEIGENHHVLLTDPSSRPFFVDNQGPAKVTVLSASICRNEHEDGVKAVNLEGDQSLVIDFSAELQGVNVHVSKNKIVVQLNRPNHTANCTVPYGFSRDITLVLTDFDDTVIVSSLITELNLAGEGGNDALYVRQTSTPSALTWDGGAGTKNTVFINNNNEVEGTVVIKSQTGVNEVEYAIMPTPVQIPGLITMISSSMADKLKIVGLTAGSNDCSFVDRDGSEVNTRFVHFGRDLIVFEGQNLNVQMWGGALADTVAVDMVNANLVLHLGGAGDNVTIGLPGTSASGRGNLHALVVHGGDGNDNVTVYSNANPVTLHGNGGSEDSYSDFFYTAVPHSTLDAGQFARNTASPVHNVNYDGFEAVRIEFMAAPATQQSTLLVRSTYGGADTEIIANGQRDVVFKPTTGIAGTSVVLRGRLTDTAIFDASAAGQKTVCQIQEGAVFELDVVDAGMPAAKASLDGVGQLVVKMGAYDDTVRILDTPVVKTTVYGNGGEDFITANNMADDSWLYVYGGAASDTFTAVPAQSLPNGQLSNIVVDGTGDAVSKPNPAVLDQVRIHAFGRGGYDITVTDDDNGVELKVFGSDRGEKYLLRKGLLVQMNDQDDSDMLETVHYTDNHVERFTIEAARGDDTFIVDSTGDVPIYLYGEDGNDMFVFGQVYTSKRNGEANLTIAEQAQVSVQRTSLGYLSTGNLAPLRAFGMDGDDRFYVQSNDAELVLNGNAGNDYFSVRSFTLENEEAESVRQSLIAEGNRSAVLEGEKGDDYIQYDENAAVNVDGGEGFNTMVIIGTPFPDQFVIQGLEVYGAGRYTRAINIQRFVVASQEGNDEIYLLSSSPYCSTAITAGTGSDKVFITPSSVPPVAAKTQGQSGVLSHTFDASRYSDQASDKRALEKALAVIDGFFAYVINREVPTLVLDQEWHKRRENTVVFESGLFVSKVPVAYKEICYSLRVAAADPNMNNLVFVQIPKTLKSGLYIMQMHVNGKEHTDPLRSIAVSTTSTRICLSPNQAAYDELNSDLSNHGERYLAITHSVDTSSSVSRRARAGFGDTFIGAEKTALDQRKTFSAVGPSPSPPPSPSPSTTPAPSPSTTPAPSPADIAARLNMAMPGMFFVRLLISHENGVHKLAPTRSLSVTEGAGKGADTADTHTQTDQYEMLMTSPDLPSHAVDVGRGTHDWLGSTDNVFKMPSADLSGLSNVRNDTQDVQLAYSGSGALLVLDNTELMAIQGGKRHTAQLPADAFADFVFWRPKTGTYHLIWRSFSSSSAGAKRSRRYESDQLSKTNMDQFATVSPLTSASSDKVYDSTISKDNVDRYATDAPTPPPTSPVNPCSSHKKCALCNNVAGCAWCNTTGLYSGDPTDIGHCKGASAPASCTLTVHAVCYPPPPTTAPPTAPPTTTSSPPTPPPTKYYDVYMSAVALERASYTHLVKGCVHGHNIILRASKTVAQCEALCEAEPRCKAFEYGVAHGGAYTGYKPSDCQLQDSENGATCSGAYHNLDLYIKRGWYEVSLARTKTLLTNVSTNKAAHVAIASTYNVDDDVVVYGKDRFGVKTGLVLDPLAGLPKDPSDGSYRISYSAAMGGYVLFNIARSYSSPLAASGMGECGELQAVASSSCPTIIPGDAETCDRVPFGSLCESDGECGGNTTLNNCGTYDIYKKNKLAPPDVAAGHGICGRLRRDDVCQ